MPMINLKATKAAAPAIELLCSGDICAAGRWLSNQASKNDIVDCISNLTLEQVDTVAGALHIKIKGALDALVAAEDENTRPSKPPQAAVEAATLIKSGASVIKVLLESTKANVPNGLTSIVFELHDNGLLAISGPLAVQEAVAKLLIDYWLMEAPRAAEVVVQLGPFLLWRAIEGKAADVKRLHAVREAFGILDLKQPESQDTVNMILSACITPTFLRCAEGRRTLAYFFEMDADLARRLVRAMKGQICVGKSSMMDAFGEILFKAWQIRSEQSKDHIEGCIQQLMHDAIMAQSTQMSINMRKVLNYLHEQRRFHGVGFLLHRLYEPILWCHLKAAHFQVRLNALGILLEAFPIQDTTGNVETEESINMQLTHLMKALRDPNAEVRAAAAWGACELLTSWWELLPGQAISRIMVLLQDTAFDADAPKVRMALIEGLGLLVDNPLAQQSMALLLPNLRRVMFDPNANVRMRMASLMMRVSQIKAFKWWNIVPVPELLSVMAKDCDAVAKIVQAMLFSQYIDCGASSSLEGCVGLLQLLRDNTSAGVAFCKFLAEQAASRQAEGVSLNLIASWSTLLTTHLIECRIGEHNRTGTSAIAHQSENSDEAEDQTSSSQGMDGCNDGGGMKRPRAIEAPDTAVLEDVESAEEWTSLLAGLQALLIPLHEELLQAGRSDILSDIKRSKTRKGKARGRTKEAAIVQPLSHTLVAHALVSLLEKAPSIQAAQVVLSIGCSTSSTNASEQLCQRCLNNLQGGYLYLPGIKKPGQRSVCIHVHGIPRQGRLSGNHLANSSVICQAVDLVLKCKPQEFVSLLADTLTATEGQVTTEGKRRRGRNKLCCLEVQPSSLNVSGALVLLAMATRDASSQRMFASSLQNEKSLSWLFDVMTQFVSQLADPDSPRATDKHDFRHDALLVERSVFIISALACEARVNQGVSPYESIKSHAESVRSAIINHVEVGMQQVAAPSEIAKICSKLIERSMKLSDVKFKTSKKKAQGGTVSRVEANIAYPQATMLRIVCDAVYDLAVAANTAVDVVEELVAERSECDTAVDTQSAAGACRMAWQALQQLIALHAHMFKFKSGKDVEVHELNHDCVDVAICSKLGVQAIFRGMGLFHVDGDVLSLLGGVGTSLAILHATCGCHGAAVNAKTHLADLACASLTGCIYVDTDDASADKGSTPMHTPMRSYQQAEKAMGMLIKPSILILGHQQQQSVSTNSPGGHSWIADLFDSLDVGVAEAVRTTIAAQLKKWIDIEDDREVGNNNNKLKTGCQAALLLLEA